MRGQDQKSQARALTIVTITSKTKNWAKSHSNNLCLMQKDCFGFVKEEEEEERTSTLLTMHLHISTTAAVVPPQTMRYDDEDVERIECWCNSSELDYCCWLWVGNFLKDSWHEVTACLLNSLFCDLAWLY